ncbi:MAG: phosphotransferase family protein [Dongiaceae bacterium]
MMRQPAFSADWLRDAIADLPTEGGGLLGHGLWGPTVDLRDGTVLKLVRHRAGIGDGLDIQGNEARVLAARGGRRLGPLEIPRLVAHGIFAAHTAAATHGYAAWLRLSRVAGTPFGEERLARLSGRERERFAAGFGEAIAVLQSEANRVLGRSAALDDRVRALLAGLATASPSDADLCAALSAILGAIPDKRRGGFVHGDAHLSNLLVDEDGLVCGVIDFAEAGRGVPEIDLAYLHWLPEIAAGVRRSYEAAAHRIDEAAYHLAGAIYALTGAVITEQNGGSDDPAADRRLLGVCLEAIGLGRSRKKPAR